MKRNIYLFIVLFSLALFTGCDKSDKQSTSTELSVTQTGTIATNQSVIFTMGAAKATDNVAWSAKPETVTITPNGNTAAVLFKASGSYTITGTFGGVTSSSGVTVKDTVVSNPLYKDVAFATGEQINITVSKINDSVAKSGLIFVGQSTKKYNCKSTVRSTFSATTTSLTINLNGVSEPTTPTCVGTTTDTFIGGVGNIQPIAPGATIALTINFNGTVYTGSIFKSPGGSFTISWPYISGVVISPVSL